MIPEPVKNRANHAHTRMHVEMIQHAHKLEWVNMASQTAQPMVWALTVVATSRCPLADALGILVYIKAYMHACSVPTWKALVSRGQVKLAVQVTEKQGKIAGSGQSNSN